MMDNKRLRNIYKMMVYRCTNSKYDKYKYYGAKGIKVYKLWLKSYESFERWALASGYQDNLTLDRIENFRGYYPWNCRWVDMKDQANNRSSNRLITHDGKTQSTKQWADEYGISYGTFRNRLAKNPDVEKALKEPIKDTRKPVYITYNGVTKRMFEWTNQIGINPTTFRNRLLRGWSVEKAIKTMLRKI